VEFGDYQCPACASFATRFKPQVDSAFVTTGRARFLFYDLPLTSLHDNAVIAARAAHCAGDQDRFWDYHEELFREQSQWAPLALPAQALVGYAASLGLNADEFGTCLSSGRHSNVVDANDALGAALGINSTPTILIMVDGGGIWRARAYNFQTVASTFEAAVAAVP
jgi:protein-disulfide isomerase